MNMCVGNLAIEENSWREIRPVKISQRKRIDGGVALDRCGICVMLEHAGAERVYNGVVHEPEDYL
jgi:phage terminase large subunit-like protein